jgi:hypothetical protein
VPYEIFLKTGAGLNPKPAPGNPKPYIVSRPLTLFSEIISCASLYLHGPTSSETRGTRVCTRSFADHQFVIVQLHWFTVVQELPFVTHGIAAPSVSADQRSHQHDESESAKDDE